MKTKAQWLRVSDSLRGKAGPASGRRGSKGAETGSPWEGGPQGLSRREVGGRRCPAPSNTHRCCPRFPRGPGPRGGRMSHQRLCLDGPCGEADGVGVAPPNPLPPTECWGARCCSAPFLRGGRREDRHPTAQPPWGPRSPVLPLWLVAPGRSSVLGHEGDSRAWGSGRPGAREAGGRCPARGHSGTGVRGRRGHARPHAGGANPHPTGLVPMSSPSHPTRQCPGPALSLPTEHTGSLAAPDLCELSGPLERAVGSGTAVGSPVC